MQKLYISKDQYLLENSNLVSIIPGKKYKISLNARYISGNIFSCYFTILMFNNRKEEVSRRIKWINDISGKKNYKIIAKSSLDTRYALCGLRINVENCLKSDWHGELDDIINFECCQKDDDLYDEYDEYSDIHIYPTRHRVTRLDTISYEVRCPICRSKALSPEQEYETILGYKQFFLRCNECGSLFDDNPKQIDYQNSYYDTNSLFNIRAYVERNASFVLPTYILLQAERAMGFLGTNSQKRKLLEIGCGPGILVDIARYLGWESKGIDSSEKAVEFGLKYVGSTISNFTVNNFIAEKDLDTIVSLNIIEHLAQPDMFLRAIYQALTADGIAIFQTPNSCSRSCYQSRTQWPHMGFGHHLLLYSPSSLEMVLTEVGFKGVLIYTFNGEYSDEELICIATKKTPTPDFYKTIFYPFCSDQQAVAKCIDYCTDNINKLDSNRNSLWFGSFFRLIESFITIQRYDDAISTANNFELMLVEKGITHKRAGEILNRAIQENDRKVFCDDKIFGYLPDFYYLRGIAHQQKDENEKAERDFQLSFDLWKKLEVLPESSWTEVASAPATLRCLFSLGTSLHKQGKHEKARERFLQILSRREELSHTPSFLATTMYTYARILETLDQPENAYDCYTTISNLYHSNQISRDIFISTKHQIDMLVESGRITK